MESDPEKIARTESLFREVNERIAEKAERMGAEETAFVCECADPACAHRVPATLEEYEGVRESGATFLLLPGHQDERVEAVVVEEDHHAVVEKWQKDARGIALELDPRADAA